MNAGEDKTFLTGISWLKSVVSWQQKFGDKFYGMVEFTVYELPMFSYSF